MLCWFVFYFKLKLSAESIVCLSCCVIKKCHLHKYNKPFQRDTFIMRKQNDRTCYLGNAGLTFFLSIKYMSLSVWWFQIEKIPCKHSNTPRPMQWLYICQVSRQLIENKNDFNKTKMAAAVYQVAAILIIGGKTEILIRSSSYSDTHG